MRESRHTGRSCLMLMWRMLEVADLSACIAGARWDFVWRSADLLVRHNWHLRHELHLVTDLGMLSAGYQIRLISCSLQAKAGLLSCQAWLRLKSCIMHTPP